MSDTLIRLRPRNDALYVSRGRTVLVTGLDGCVADPGRHGLFVHQTRLLSRYRYLISGEAPQPVALSNVDQFSWLGYYVTVPPGLKSGFEDHGSGQLDPVSQQTLELRSSRYAGNGLHEDLDLTNYSQRATSFRLELEVDADFADQYELAGRRQWGEVSHEFQTRAGNGADLAFHYQAEHRGEPPEADGVARIQRGLTIRIDNASSPPDYGDARLKFQISLGPGETWHACLHFVPDIDGVVLEPVYQCRAFAGTEHKLDSDSRIYLREATQFSAPQRGSLTPVVLGALEQAKSDLLALRLHDLDESPREWTVAAGLPQYLALFGRDTLTAAWQSGICSRALMRGTLKVLARLQGTRQDDWRDEQPGRMLHEAHTGPLAMLNYNPRRRYYGTITTPGFFPVVLSELWRWTGDPAAIQPFVEPALRALRWLDENCDSNGDGFYYYQTRSPQGVRHQAWKDSPDAIVTAEGVPVEPPVATCEEQGFIHAARLHMSEVLWWLDRKDDAKRLYREAGEQKKRFNDVFWMPEEGFVALGLDGEGRPVRSITSNPGHSLAAGIVDGSLVRPTADRLFEPDLFSGWGIRTLSEQNPAYNPYSYHRGSVWPVEQGTFALGFYRYGLHAHVERICRAIFETASLFDFYRLPEVFSGHPRDADHPFPAFYPQACSPQAWSASTVFLTLQAMLGLYPYAPLNMLLVDPHLPQWLPEITLENLQVGDASVTIRFRRKRDGSSTYRILDKRGALHVVRQPSPWSLTAGFSERLNDALLSLLPGR